jgi:hypothetical protein
MAKENQSGWIQMGERFLDVGYFTLTYILSVMSEREIK